MNSKKNIHTDVRCLGSNKNKYDLRCLKDPLIQNHHYQPNPLTPISDQDRISLYIIYTVTSRQVMRIEKNNINFGLLANPIPNSPN